MTFIRGKETLKTGYQESEPFNDLIDFHQDFVMVYGIGNNLEERLNKYRMKGYLVHLMTGSSWGDYDDYYDGKSHYEEEGQVDENYQHMDHLQGKIPYMVPVASFCDYLVVKLKKAIDYGVTAFHLEEPEFWSFTGYSEAFKKEYEMYYQEPYLVPKTSLEQLYKCNRLKQFLYCRALEYLSWRLKDYGLQKYHQQINFYVPTHSLLNYSQWKIISPEGNLTNSNYIDGIIAQVWTGTSREPNTYLNVTKERTFETAFLEYGASVELVRGTKKAIWFLNDPIEDNPTYTWDNYKENYLKTLTASLLYSSVDKFEICPWPNRIFNRKLPDLTNQEKYRNIPEDVKPSYISPEYATFLNNIFNTLGDIEVASDDFCENKFNVGIFLSDTCMYQREYPQNLVPDDQIKKGSLTFPDFYGLSLPLLKEGLPVKVLNLEKIMKDSAYLAHHQILVLSYEYLKPESIEINYCFYRYVLEGGLLLFVDSFTDAYNKITSWWQEARYQSPGQHLCHLLKDGKNGKGYFKHLKLVPALICENNDKRKEYLDCFKTLLNQQNITYQPKNYLWRKRGNYHIISVLDESNLDPLTIKGEYIDLFANEFLVINNPTFLPGEVGLLYEPKNCLSWQVIGTTKRVYEMVKTKDTVTYTLKGLKNLNCYFRIKLLEPNYQCFVDNKSVYFKYDISSQTLLINYQSLKTTTTIKFIKNQVPKRGNNLGI